MRQKWVISMVDGFVRIFRQAREHWTYKRSEYFHAWFEMLACAKYTPEPETRLIEGQLVAIGYGEFVFGRTSWSKRLNIPETVLRGLIKKLIKDDMIELVGRYNKCTVYKIKNYEKFNQRIDQQTDQQQTQQNQGVKGYNNQRIAGRKASKRPTGNHTQEVKEGKEFNKDSSREIENFRQRYSDFIDLIDEYLDILRTTRVSNKISNGVIYKVYEQMSKHPVVVVKYALHTIIKNPSLHSKKENYLYGILRNTKADEAVRKLNKFDSQIPEGKDYGINLRPEERYFD